MMVFAKKTLGQHWLKDQEVLRAIVQAAAINDGDHIIEIGAGTGALTGYLAQSGASLLALEIDRDLIPGLQSKFAGLPVEIEATDIRRFDLSKLPLDYKLVANIPYYLTAFLLRKLTETANKPIRAVILVQREVAERVAAGPGKMTLLAVLVQSYYTVSLGRIVPASAFAPSPNVDSRVLILKRLPQALGRNNSSACLKIIKAAFTSPRKTLLNNLTKNLGLNRANTEKLIKHAGLSANIRAQDLTLIDWQKIAEIYTKAF